MTSDSFLSLYYYFLYTCQQNITINSCLTAALRHTGQSVTVLIICFILGEWVSQQQYSKHSAGYVFPDQIGSGRQDKDHPISAIYSAAAMWIACRVSTISVLDCLQIISVVLPSDSLHLAGTDKAPPEWPGGHNFTTEVNGRDRPLCPSKCNFRLSLQCCHFPDSRMLWINLKNMEWEIAPAVVRAETPLGLYF